MSALLLLAAASAAVALQLTLPFGWLPLDFTIMLAVFVGLGRGGYSGTLTGFFCGLVLDSLVSPVFGLYTLATSLAGGMADLLHENFNTERFLGQAVTMAALTLIHDLSLWQAAAWIGLDQVTLFRFFSVYAFPKMLTHGVLAVPVFFIFRRFVRPVAYGKFRGVPKMIRTLPKFKD